MLATVVALSLAAAVLTACSSPEAADEVTSREAASSAVDEETATPSASSGSGDAGIADGGTAEGATSDGGGTVPGVGTGITPSEQDELEAELAAIERELDAMALPDDTDFSDIEGALQ